MLIQRGNLEQVPELDLSVVIPLYQEEENVDPAVEEVLGVLDNLPHSSELILVDDGSVDRTGDLALAWAKRDPRIRVVQFRRNFGQTAAIQAGFDHSRGSTVVLMDGDQQNDPRDIPMMLDKMGEGFDVVSGWRKNRQDRAISRKLPSKIANGLISRLTGTRLHDYGCTLKAYDSEVVRHLRLYGELHRFIPALAALAGARVTEMPVNHRARTRGQSKYGISRTLRVVLDLITVKFLLRYLTKPMQFFGKWGILSSVIGLGVILYLVGDKIFASQPLDGRPLLILASVALLGGLVLFCTGLLGEVLTRIYHESGSRGSYTVRTAKSRQVVPNAVTSIPDQVASVFNGRHSDVGALAGVRPAEGI
jgi:glycosyltransferase involved in cell wall biosynthesis